VAGVAITGVGLITPLGRGVAANWSAVAEGRIGVRGSADPGVPAGMRFVGRVDAVAPPSDLPDELLPQVRFLNRGALLGLAAMDDALAQAAPLDAAAPERRALYLATGDFTKLGYEFLYPATQAATREGRDAPDRETLNRAAIEKVNPFFLLESLHNNPYSILTAAFGVMGPGTTLGSQSPSGSSAVELACRTIRGGRADVAVAVGCGSWVNEVALFELAGLGLLSSGRHGIHSYRPFDRRRDGFLAGEGGAAIVLEPDTSARARGARILGWVEGDGSATEPAPGLRAPRLVTLRAMQSALERAGRTAADLGFVCTHGSGTRKGDASELASLAALLGNDAVSVPVCALKPDTGHMGAASDVAEVALGVVAASTGVVPATPSFTTTEPAFATLRIAGSPQRCARPLFLTASYGLGGQASALVVSAAEGAGRWLDRERR
jgi:3-oxoacyl-[acyl-carrier-protein] synthase II